MLIPSLSIAEPVVWMSHCCGSSQWQRKAPHSQTVSIERPAYEKG